MTATIGQLLSDAAARLRAAGVASPDNDARYLLAEAMGLDSPMDVIVHAESPVDTNLGDAVERLVERRAQREPLQHILRRAPFGPLDLKVGPGVFIPRPETETLADWGVRQLARMAAKEGRTELRVVDLCTGSGALALYIDALTHPTPETAWLTPSALRGGVEVAVRGVDKDPGALEYARANARKISGGRVEMMAGDVTTLDVLADWRGSVDVVVTNPPYVPETSDLAPEVYADPHHAVFAGEDGMSVIPAMLPLIAELLRPGGVVGIEHDDATSAAVVAAFRECGWAGLSGAEFGDAGSFGDIATLADLAGVNRFVVASKIGESSVSYEQ